MNPKIPAWAAFDHLCAATAQMDGDTIRIFVASDDMEDAASEVMFGAGDPGMPGDGGMLTSPSGVQAAAVTLFGAKDIQVNWMAGSNAQGQYVALLTEDYTMLVGELVELGPDATSYKFSNVGSGTFGVAVISYRIVDGEIKYGFEFDDIQMVTLP